MFGAYIRLGILHHTHTVALLESGSESIFFRCLSGSEPGGTSLTPYACETTRCCTCSTPSSSRSWRVRLHRQRFDGDVIPPSVFKDRVASGVVRGSPLRRGSTSMTTSTTFTRERFPLNGLHTGMLPISLCYLLLGLAAENNNFSN